MDKNRLYLLAENKVHSTGCQHACVKMAQFSFQKIAEDTLGKDIQEVPDW